METLKEVSVDGTISVKIKKPLMCITVTLTICYASVLGINNNVETVVV